MPVGARKARPESEKAIERHVGKQVKKLGGLSLKTNPTNQKGLPDRMILLPGGKMGFLELKSTGKKPTALQAHWLDVLTNLGFKAGWVDSKAKADLFLSELENCSGEMRSELGELENHLGELENGLDEGAADVG